MPTISEYPFLARQGHSINEIKDLEGNVTTTLHKAKFLPVVLEIGKKWDTRGLGFTFVDGPKNIDGYNVIWNLEQTWKDGWANPDWLKAVTGTDEDPFTWDEGDVVRVNLVRDDYMNKSGQPMVKHSFTKGSKKVPADTEVSDPWLIDPSINGAADSDDAPTEEVASPPVAKGSTPLDSRILKHGAFNNITVALFGANPIEDEYLKEVWEEALAHAMKGEPVFQPDDALAQAWLLEREEVVPKEQASMFVEFDRATETPDHDIDYEVEAKSLMVSYFGLDHSDEAVAWMKENVGEEGDYANTQAYWFATYLKAQKL